MLLGLVARLAVILRRHRAATEALRSSEARFKKMFNLNPLSVQIVDQNGFTLEVNPAHTRLFGAVPPSDYSVFQDPLIERQGLSEHFETARRGEVAEFPDFQYNIHELKPEWPDTPLWIQMTVFMLPDEKGKPESYVLMHKDITERKRAEAEREKLHIQLAQSQKMESIGALAGGVAHDFNNMLGVIMGHTELGMMQTDPTEPIYRRLNQILDVSRRSGDLVQQLLAFARKQIIAPRVLDLNYSVEEMLRMLRRLIGEHVHLIWRPDPHLWRVKLDPSQVSQLLVNLCINARDAIADTGSITIETRTMVLNEEDANRYLELTPGEYVLLSVSDTGSGIPSESLPHIFDPFYTTKKVGQGTGLGLATVYGIVRQNQGYITVYSEPQQGTCFTIYLPRHAETTPEPTTLEATEALPGGHETILLVEDAPELLETAAMMLETLGYRVISAATPPKALELAAAHSGKIDLLITDVIMPDMNGRELASRLTAQFPDLHCLFMSGYTADIIARRGILDEGMRFIQKPFSLQQLARKVRKAVQINDE